MNLAEGSGRSSRKEQRKEQKRFFDIAFGSLRECQAILLLVTDEKLNKKTDILAAHLYNLIQAVKREL